MPDKTVAAPTKARGVLEEARDERVIISFPNTSYRLHLHVLKPPSTPIGKRIHGTIRLGARRIDVVHTGGSYIEPVYGEPRRVQGEIIAVEKTDGSIVVNAGPCPIHVKLGKLQKPEQFQPGDFVSFDAESGASFTPT